MWKVPVYQEDLAKYHCERLFFSIRFSGGGPA